MHVTPWDLVLLILAGAGTGVLGAILGTGGGVFLIPVFVLGFGLPMQYAVAASLVSVIATSTAVASTNVERGTANMRLGMTLEVATALGAIVGGLTAGILSTTALEIIFGVVLLPTAWFMWRGRGETETTAKSEDPPLANESRATGAIGGEYYDDATCQRIVYRVERLWAGMLVSFFAGNLSGMLGIGGGVFKVPALHLLCKVPIKAAAATSNFMIGVTAAASAFLYYGRGEVRSALTASVVLGILFGSNVGSRLNRRVNGDLVRRIFAVLLIMVAVQMFIRAR